MNIEQIPYTEHGLRVGLGAVVVYLLGFFGAILYVFLRHLLAFGRFVWSIAGTEIGLYAGVGILVCIGCYAVGHVTITVCDYLLGEQAVDENV